MVINNLPKRFINNDCGEDGICNSSWNNWIRWLVLALIIVAAFLLFFGFSCISSRRRRRMGYQPYRGTGWALGSTPAGHAAPTYTQQPYYANTQQPHYNNSNNPAPPPAYTPPSNRGYYGGNDVELQQPQASYGGYRGGENVYAPPKGPPPGQS